MKIIKKIIEKIAITIFCIFMVCLVLAAAWGIFSQVFAGPAEFISNLIQTNPLIGIPLLIIAVIMGFVILVLGFIVIASSA